MTGALNGRPADFLRMHADSMWADDKAHLPRPLAARIKAAIRAGGG